MGFVSGKNFSFLSVLKNSSPILLLNLYQNIDLCFVNAFVTFFGDCAFSSRYHVWKGFLIVSRPLISVISLLITIVFNKLVICIACVLLKFLHVNISIWSLFKDNFLNTKISLISISIRCSTSIVYLHLPWTTFIWRFPNQFLLLKSLLNSSLYSVYVF